MCKLLSERGYAATSPQAIWTRADCTRGSFQHYFPAKELIGLAAIEDFTRRDTAYLREHLDSAVTEAEAAHRKNPEPEPDSVRRVLVEQARACLYLLFSRRGGHALIRLLADPDVAASPALVGATRDWLDRLRAELARTFTGKPVRTLGVAFGPKQAGELAVRMVNDAMGEALPSIGRVPPLQ
ncbi:MAG: TetR/AcrR family transcriptional regulator [Actinomycetia bacterium]|nr:TetR/AcrR family transcriptional regulator [Actinomycetes bacterium]